MIGSISKPVLAPAFCAANKIIISNSAADTITFGLVNFADTVLKERIKKAYHKYRCVFREMDQKEFSLKISQLFSVDEGQNITSENSGGENGRSAIEMIDTIADNAPAVNLLNSIFLEALSARASDIHIESGGGGAAIQYRIDGLLIHAGTISAERAAAVSARLKVIANLNVLENRRPQDGHIEINTDDYSLDVRISIVPTIQGESIVLRLLNRSDIPLNPDSLGFSQQHSAFIKNIPGISSGLILVTGPTGSGKTTTLAAILGELNNGSRKIISIEDPVEYRIEGITQIQVHEELDLTFETILRRIFRQDPDIIMIGEIRDIVTAELAVRAALTGHLVFATLHTNNAAEALCRLQNMGIQSYMAAAVLRAIIAQRLIRKICKSCKGSGCAGCSRTGYSGRTAVAEIIAVDEKLRNIIAAGGDTVQLKTYLAETNFKTLFDDAEEKLKAGITAAEEIRRELGARA